MPTQSIKLKIFDCKDVTPKILEAHKLFNEYVKRFEQFLLLIRGKDYYFTNEQGEEEYRSAEETQQSLRKYLSDRGIAKNRIEMCAEELSKLVDVIAENGRGAKNAGSLGKLYDGKSTSGTNNAGKIIDPLPDWTAHFDGTQFEDSKYKLEADAWIKSEEGQKAIEPMIYCAGPSNHFKKAYLNKNEWYADFVKVQDRFRKENESGLTGIILKLDKLNALPIIDVEENLLEKKYSRWIRLMLKTALENYLSYLESDKTTRENYSKVTQKLEQFQEEVKRDYLKQRDAIECFLKDNYIATDRSSYLTRRMSRNLGDVLFEWKKCNSFDERISVLNEMQSSPNYKHNMGDVNFFRWLAEDSNLYIADSIDFLLEYFDCLRESEMKKKCAAYTVADPVKSKRYISYDRNGGTNYKSYDFGIKDDCYTVTIPLLLKDKNGQFFEEKVELKLAKSKQFQNVRPQKDGKVSFNNNKTLYFPGRYEFEKECFWGLLKGADLRVETTDTGKLTGLFMSFSVEVDEKSVGIEKKECETVLRVHQHAYEKKSREDEKIVGKQIRCIAIDLGLKQFCAAAVGEITYDRNPKETQDIDIERMFLIKMPGEDVSGAVDEARFEAIRKISLIKSEIKYVSLLKRIFHQDSEGREKILKRAVEYYKHPDKLGILSYCMDNIQSPEEVEKCLVDEYNRMISSVNQEMKAFRSGETTRKQKRDYRPGKSYWAIYYLEQVRQLLLSWSSLSYTIADENRLQGKRYGVTATRLLRHIQNLKDDRIKEGADAIIQAALGFYYDTERKAWIQKYEPCHVIIFEDLSRYMFTSDRPRAENSKLMRWSHREIIGEVKRQASIYGIEVFDSTDAAFSSKYHYKTGAPGIRCDRLKARDFDSNGKLKEYRLNFLPESMRENADRLKPGDLIPADIGSIFATVDKNGRLSLINADMNAACNLLNRFFSFHTHLISLKTENRSGALYLKAAGEDAGKRVKGKLLYHYGTDKMVLVPSKEQGHFKLDKAQKKKSAPNVGTKAIYNLFRDPSGYIYPSEEFVGYTEFWNHVKAIIETKLADLV